MQSVADALQYTSHYHPADFVQALRRAAYLLSRAITHAITHAKALAFEDLGMEAIHEFELKDFPVTVAVDSQGQSAHSRLFGVSATQAPTLSDVAWPPRL